MFINIGRIYLMLLNFYKHLPNTNLEIGVQLQNIERMQGRQTHLFPVLKYNNQEVF